MKECPQCGVILSLGQTECTFCSALPARQASPGASEEIDRLLAEANLLRIRKQPDDAISLCTRVLRLDPQNAGAHALMGDIHRDEGNYREALGWYKLATQLDPGNAADRKKLDDMIDRVFKNSAQGDVDYAEPTPAQRETTDRVGDRLRALLEKITPVHVVVASSVVAVLVAGVILLQPPAKSNATDSRPATSSEQVEGTPVDEQHPASGTPTVTPPNADKVEGGGTITGVPGVTIIPGNAGKGETAQAPGTLPTPEQATGQSASPKASGPAMQVPPFEPQGGRNRMTAEELQKQTNDLRAALEESLKESKIPSELNGVSIDPRTRVASIYFTVPPMKGPVETKQGLLYTGFKLVWAADKALGSLRSYEISGYAPTENGADSSLALVAEISPRQADDAREAGDYRAVAKFLSNVWWRNDLDVAEL